MSGFNSCRLGFGTKMAVHGRLSTTLRPPLYSILKIVHTGRGIMLGPQQGNHQFENLSHREWMNESKMDVTTGVRV